MELKAFFDWNTTEVDGIVYSEPTIGNLLELSQDMPLVDFLLFLSKDKKSTKRAVSSGNVKWMYEEIIEWLWMKWDDGNIVSHDEILFSICFLAKYYGVDIDSIRDYRRSRLGKMMEMIQYIENPKKLEQIKSNRDYFTSKEDARHYLLKKMWRL